MLQLNINSITFDSTNDNDYVASMSKPKQLSFKNTEARTNSFGGGNARSHQKTERPLARKKWIHFILKSERAKGAWSFLRHKLLIKDVVEKKAKQHGVVIADMANVGNHIHFKIKITNRELFQSFEKALTGIIARKDYGGEEGKSGWKILGRSSFHPSS